MDTNQLSQEFDGKKLIQFTLSTIIMMLFLSLYTSVDGAFVSNLVSEHALSAINIVFPVINIFMAVSLMLATGSNAIIARNMGENRLDDARRFLSLVYIVGAILGVLMGAIAVIFIDDLLVMMGTTPLLYDYAKEYLVVLSLFTPMCVLQIFAQGFFVTVGKPKTGLIVTIIGGVANVVLDYVFIEPLGMGIVGAAGATGIGYSIPALYGLYYFSTQRKGTLYFEMPRFEYKKIVSSCLNGSSELVSNLSMAVTTLIFNLSMLKYVGETGVAAITIIMYVQFIQMAIYFGYSMGVGPVISYKYGEGNSPQLKKIIGISIKFIAVSSLAVILLSLFGADLAIGIFVQEGSEVFAIAKRGFIIFATSYLFMGFNVFASSMFTAFGNGKVSAILSFLRTLVLLVGALVILPLFWGVDGVWLAVPLAEGLAFIISLICFIKYKSIYNY